MSNEDMIDNPAHEREMNTLRRANIKKILESKKYSAKTEGYETACVDLLADLLHFCKTSDLDFDDLLHVATNHFEAEFTVEKS